MPSLPEPAPFDVIVVPGAAQFEDGRPGPAMERRMRHAVARLHEGLAPLLMLSGGRTRAADRECDTMARLARGLGIDGDRILLETRATRTLENAAYCAGLLRRHGLRRCLLVTDRFHMARALMSFRAFGVDVSPDPVVAPWSIHTLASMARELVARRVYPKRIETYQKAHPESAHDRR